MNRQLNTMMACVVSLASSIVPRAASAQDAKETPRSQDREPPGRDWFVPYLPAPGLPKEKEFENVEQVKILAEMNRLTVELVMRRSDSRVAHADTPLLVKRLKELAKKLHDVQ
jgi:hypothetical protein